MNSYLLNTYIGLDIMGIGSVLSDLWNGFVEFFFGQILYGPVRLICSLLGYLYSCFEVVAGIDTVEYYGDSSKNLIEVFFTNSALTKAYWGMALIGIVLTFGFTIWAVIKKMFDIDDKVKASLGQILREAFKSILIICSMNLLVALLLFTNSSLLTAVENTFQLAMVNRGDNDNKDKSFTPEQYATMARIFNTISNYAMNDSYDSRYNVNSCYNDIRYDLKSLSEQNVFAVSYEHPDSESGKQRYWQETLQAIVNAYDLQDEAMLDYNNATLTNAIVSAMEIVKTDNSFGPIQHFKATSAKVDETAYAGSVEIDKIVLLMGTFGAAKNSKYNGTDASIYDNARRPYMNGDKGYDVYTASDMYKNFDLAKYNFIIVAVVAIILIYNMMIIIFNCIARMFNMAVLYLVFPAVAAASPMDGGSKFKQWTTAFVVQFLGVFGTIIAMHLLVLFFPLIMDGHLVLFDNAFLNMFAKLMILVGAYESARKASSMITGILAESAGWQSINAGDMAGSARSFAGGVAGSTGLPWLKNAIGSNIGNTIKGNLPFGDKRGAKNQGSNGAGSDSSDMENDFDGDSSGGIGDAGGSTTGAAGALNNLSNAREALAKNHGGGTSDAKGSGGTSGGDGSGSGIGSDNSTESTDIRNMADSKEDLSRANDINQETDGGNADSNGLADNIKNESANNNSQDNMINNSKSNGDSNAGANRVAATSPPLKFESITNVDNDDNNIINNNK